MAIVHQLSKEPRIGATFGRLKNGFAHIGSGVAAWLAASREVAASRITTRKVPSILINTMPKSGSIYLTRTIATSLGIEYSLTSLVDGLFPTYHMNPAALERFICGAVVRQEHFDASPHNLAMCAHYVDRLVLHVRDPRQATLSWTHHFNRLRDLDPSSTVGTIRQPPEDYCCWPFKRQLDWHIDGHLVSLVEWLRQWISAEGKSSLKILRTQYEELVNAERKELGRIKKISAANLHRNWVVIPHVTTHDEADITDLEQFRVKMNKELEKSGVKLSLLPFMVKAAVATLQKFPEFNASLDGDTLVYKNYWHIGFAADTPNGLMVPVIRDADKKSVPDIAKEMNELAKLAREGKIKPDQMQGGTFSISSLGGIGGIYFTPIINAPEVAIMGVCKGYWKQHSADGKTSSWRLTLPLSLSWDHRVIDGAAAARFNVHFANVLADLRRVLF